MIKTGVLQIIALDLIKLRIPQTFLCKREYEAHNPLAFQRQKGPCVPELKPDEVFFNRLELDVY